MNAWGLYWLTRLDYLHRLSVIFGIVLLLYCAICIIIKAPPSSNPKLSIKHSVISGFLSVFLFIMSVFTPTNSDLAIIIAGSWASNNKEMSALPEKTVKVLNVFLDKYLEKNKEK